MVFFDRDGNEGLLYNRYFITSTGAMKQKVGISVLLRTTEVFGSEIGTDTKIGTGDQYSGKNTDNGYVHQNW